jgi:type IV secretory pathway VirB3-like protein
MLHGVSVRVQAFMFAAAMLGEISTNVFMFSCVTILAFMVSQMNFRK